jgi:hypothetical protein
LLTEIDRETRRHETLILTLAEELYQREHGTAPARLGDLLGPDLQALPGGLSPDDPPSSATSNRPARLGPPIDEPEEKP